MGNKCCSKRQPDEFATGYKKNETNFTSNLSNPKHNSNSLDSRYTPDPNRSGVIKHTKSGIDIIRSGPRSTGKTNKRQCWVVEEANYHRFTLQDFRQTTDAS